MHHHEQIVLPRADKFPILPLLFAATTIIMATAQSAHSSLITTSHNLFANDIFQVIASERPQANIVFSPASIQSCLALAYLGAEGKTAEQMHKSLRLPNELDKNGIAEQFAIFLRDRFNAKPNMDEKKEQNAPKLRLANRIYVNESLQISSQYNELAKKSFDTEAVATKFSDSIGAADSINTWVEGETEGKIRNLIQPDALTADTSAILVNAIYFKGKWLKPFSQMSTANAEFKMADGRSATVPMMYGDERLRYGSLAALDATVLEMPYKDSDLSMMILLPNKIEGLLELEQKMSTTDLNHIDGQLKMEHVQIMLPKFRIEFDIDLKEPLQKLGLTEMFGASADFSSLFAQKQQQRIDGVKHKAFIDVNEAGSEAAAATFLKIVPMSLNLDQKWFRADHPFVFAIRDKQAHYFIGHVATLILLLPRGPDGSAGFQMRRYHVDGGSASIGGCTTSRLYYNL